MTDRDLLAVALKEAETQTLRDKVTLAADYAEDGRKATRSLAGIWGESANEVNTLADMFHAIPLDEIFPEEPLARYRASMTCAKMHKDDVRPWKRRALCWLRLARRYGWRSRQLKDAADVSKGKRISRIPLVDHEADVVAWEGGIVEDYTCGRIELDVPDWSPSGDPPQRVKVRVVEVLVE